MTLKPTTAYAFVRAALYQLDPDGVRVALTLGGPDIFQGTDALLPDLRDAYSTIGTSSALLAVVRAGLAEARAAAQTTHGSLAKTRAQMDRQAEECVAVLAAGGYNPLVADQADVRMCAQHSTVVFRALVRACGSCVASDGISMMHALCAEAGAALTAMSPTMRAFTLKHCAVQGTTTDGQTPLHVLWSHKKWSVQELGAAWDVTRLLLTHGARITAEDTKGRTVAQLVRSKIGKRNLGRTTPTTQKCSEIISQANAVEIAESIGLGAGSGAVQARRM